MNDKDDEKISKLAKYLKQGVYQDFKKIYFLQICFYFCLFNILISEILSVFFSNERIHFLKEGGRFSFNAVSTILSYLFGRKQEKDLIKSKLGEDENDVESEKINKDKENAK